LAGRMQQIKTPFFDLIENDLNRVEDLMRASSGDIHLNLDEAIFQLLSSGGKRIRPTLTLLAGGMLEAEPQKCVTLAAAIEMLHTATLVHDDLIDGAGLRRGNPTLNSKWPVGATVLTGDYVFARAARLAADTGSNDLMKIFAETLMIMVNGEITQLFGSNHKDYRQAYFERINAKTASLFELTTYGIALLNESDETTLQAMSAFGFEIGIAFQIVDDILDFIGVEKMVGKPVASDLRNGLITLPAVLYNETNPADNSLLQIFNGQELDEDEFHALIDKIRESSAIDQAMLEAQEYIATAKQRLIHLPIGLHRDALYELADYIIRRPL